MVNFNFAFGSFGTTSASGQFLDFFIGKATAIFIILAGMGLSFMSQKAKSIEEKKELRHVILKRSFILFLLGLLFYNWWPGDILHFYGGYMHLAVLMLFLNKSWYLLVAAIVMGIYHVLLVLIPVETSWNVQDFSYQDFWTPIGFLRNTFYNGWNSIFPWFAYFLLGLYLGRIQWNKPKNLLRVFLFGFFSYGIVVLVQQISLTHINNTTWLNYLLSEYFPPYLPFMVKTAAFALMSIATCFYIGQKWPTSKLLGLISKTGRMTLSLYILHLTLGMLLLGGLSGIPYTGLLQQSTTLEAWKIVLFAGLFFLASVVFCHVWLSKFKHGPFEYLLRIKEKKQENQLKTID